MTFPGVDVVGAYTNFQCDESAGTCLLFGGRRNYYVDKLLIERIAYCLVSYGKKPAREFVPALDPEGVPCMYDLVERKPYYNLGSGQFAYG